MGTIETGLMRVRRRIRNAELANGRRAGSVDLLAVSKTRSAEEIGQALLAEQWRFGESYLQEALGKIEALKEQAVEWHFIGRIQSNKTRIIAENFAWVHSIDRAKLLHRLNDQRPGQLPPLNICLQLKVDDEESKGGMSSQEAKELICTMDEFPRLQLRGVMTVPAPAKTFEAQSLPFRRLRRIRDRLASPEMPLETLSMGMSADLEAAIAEGATIVRVGTAIFGPRKRV